MFIAKPLLMKELLQLYRLISLLKSRNVSQTVVSAAPSSIITQSDKASQAEPKECNTVDINQKLAEFLTKEE
jgi:hypothetical protein